MPDMMLPPWLQTADPASHMATGLQIGMRLGAQEAAQRMADMQLQREVNLDAQHAALQQAAIGLKASEYAKRSAAMQEYSKRVAAGEDPLKTLLELGPAMGHQGSAEAAAIRSMNMKPKTWVPATLPGLPEGAVAYTDGASGLRIVQAPEQFKDDKRRLANGAVQSGQRSTRNGRFYPDAHMYQEGWGNLTPADRAQLAQSYKLINKFLATYGGVDSKFNIKMDPQGYAAASAAAAAAAQQVLEKMPNDATASAILKATGGSGPGPATPGNASLTITRDKSGRLILGTPGTGTTGATSAPLPQAMPTTMAPTTDEERRGIYGDPNAILRVPNNGPASNAMAITGRNLSAAAVLAAARGQPVDYEAAPGSNDAAISLPPISGYNLDEYGYPITDDTEAPPAE